ncbi:hypothetical protein EBB79_12940 [Parasedimentitalea marina]|uniref:Uncharacterized protein n=1 Tax=Parasedimentitalea marina TaxID=2483033 RepID=A0A3T0N3Y3_9RHOB|nr:hypothetical protein EBB79_12940 [Parasedimentitalea marina]
MGSNQDFAKVAICVLLPLVLIASNDRFQPMADLSPEIRATAFHMKEGRNADVNCVKRRINCEKAK